MTYSISDDFAAAEAYLNGVSEPHLLLNLEGVVLASNQGAARMFGFSPGKALADRLETPEAFSEALREIEREPRAIEIPSLTLTPGGDGATLVIQLRLMPMWLDASVEDKRILAAARLQFSSLDQLEETARETDERIHRFAEQLAFLSGELLDRTAQLAEQKAKSDAIINGMEEGLIGCDEQGRVIHLNECARELLRRQEDIEPQTPIEALCPDIADALGWSRQAPSALRRQNIEISLHGRDVHIHCSPIRDEHKRFAGFVLILIDRTKQAELDRFKADLISIVSHEMRSPLTSIKGYADLLLADDSGEISAETRSALEVIAANSRRLAALIDDILDLSRLESGHLALNVQAVDVQYLCDLAYLSLKPQAQAKRLAFRHACESGLTVSGDVDRLQQALVNLVSNAIKYTPEEGSVELCARREGDNAVITVQDDGVGVSEEDLPRLFDKFFRANNERTRRIGGAGLGLAIVKSIVEAHRGEIRVQSRLGEGSAFEMVLPEFLPSEPLKE